MPPVLPRDTIAGVPVLLAEPAHDADAAERSASPAVGPPIVLWFHGFRSEAAANTAELLALAGEGLLAVGVDAVDHGARRADDLDARMAGTPGGARAVMQALAAATLAELPDLLAALGARGLGDPARVGVVGVSMGGFLAYCAAGRVPGLRAVAAVLGSPDWDLPGAPDPGSPHRHPEAFGDVALLSVTAERDANVPPGPARALHDALAGAGHAPARARYHELPGAEHLLGADDWALATSEARGWLLAHLTP